MIVIVNVHIKSSKNHLSLLSILCVAFYIFTYYCKTESPGQGKIRSTVTTILETLKIANIRLTLTSHELVRIRNSLRRQNRRKGPRNPTVQKHPLFFAGKAPSVDPPRYRLSLSVTWSSGCVQRSSRKACTPLLGVAVERDLCKNRQTR